MPDSPLDSIPPAEPAVARRIGVLLVNLGTPDATDYRSMRRYLKEFLSDRRVVDVPRLVWWPILNGIVLTTRPQRKGRDYDAVWNVERDESPLKTTSRAQAEKLAERLAVFGDRVVVDWAMRYGNPAIAPRLAALVAAGCDRVLVVPLYPQYAAATTATVGDAAFDALKAMRFQPAVRIAPPWPTEPVYVEALTASLKADVAALDWEPEVIVASFHGIPKRYAEAGDPYPRDCAETVERLRAATGFDEKKLIMTFQSRFGREEWLRPYTDETVAALARSGVRRLAVITPGFVADCLETIEEIGIENAAVFHRNGGERFHRVACLNDGAAGIDVIETVVRRELGGWI